MERIANIKAAEDNVTENNLKACDVSNHNIK